MKNPIAYVKHLVKDPVTTIAEADARKKEIMPLLYGSAGVLALGLILQIVAKLDFMAILSGIGLIGVAFCGFLILVANTAKKRFEALTCNACNTLAEIKTPEAFAKYISYTVEKDEAVYKGYSGNKEPTNGVYSLVKFSASSSAVVSVRLTCPHCGEVKLLRYSAEPFKCHAQAEKVGVLRFPEVKLALETAVKTAVNDYNDPNRRNDIPYTFHSSKNPNFEDRYSFKGANGAGAHPEYMGVRIDYHKDVEEMLEHYFVLNELSGTLTDPNPAPKKKPSGSVLPGSPQKAPEEVSEDTSETEPPKCESVAEPEAESQPVAEAVAAGVTEVIASSVPVSESTASEAESRSVAEAIAPEIVEPVVAKAPEAVIPNAKYDDSTPSVTPSEATAEKPAKSKMLIIIIASVCAALILGAVIFAIVSAIAKQNTKQDSTEPTQSTTLPQETEESTNTTAPVPDFHVNDYVGYWHLENDTQKELTIHSGDQNSITFSLRYDRENTISNVNAQLQENAATFSLAAEGAVIKGKLTFCEASVTLEITQSTLAAIPVGTLDFTSQDMVSWDLPVEETTPEPTQPALPSFNEVPYLFSAKVSSTIYSGPSYSSTYVDSLPIGVYTIVAEEYDAYHNLWGRLKSGLGWICITELESQQENMQLEAWQTAYLDLLGTIRDEFVSYALVYVDADSIPELYTNGNCEATGDCVYTYKNGSVIEQHLSRTYGGRYIERAGLLRNTNGNMGYYRTEVYTLDENGFTSIFSGHQEESVETAENGDYNISYKFFIDDRMVSESEFDAAVAEVFDDSRAIVFHENAVDYQTITEQILNS